LSQLSYDETGRLCWPARHERAGEEALAGYLAEARALFDALADRPCPDGGCETGVSEDFEELRWFELPAGCIAPASPTA